MNKSKNDNKKATDFALEDQCLVLQRYRLERRQNKRKVLRQLAKLVTNVIRLLWLRLYRRYLKLSPHHEPTRKLN